MVAYAQRNSPQCLHLFASALISPAQKGQALNMTDSASSGATGIGSRLGRKQGSPLAFPPPPLVKCQLVRLGNQKDEGVNMDKPWAQSDFEYSGSAAELAEHVIAVVNEMGKVTQVDKAKGSISGRLNKPSMMAGFSRFEAIIMSTRDGSSVDVTITSPVSYAKGAETQAMTEINEFGRRLKARGSGGSASVGW